LFASLRPAHGCAGIGEQEVDPLGAGESGQRALGTQ
jgi:hypothetical protein